MGGRPDAETAGADTAGTELDDETLTRLALAADPDAPIDPDATPFGVTAPSPLLPEWYMPAPRSASRSRRRRLVVAGIVLALVLVNGAGLCVTYGLPTIAW